MWKIPDIKELEKNAFKKITFRLILLRENYIFCIFVRFKKHDFQKKTNMSKWKKNMQRLMFWI